ncbi:MAG: glycoside hydrolase family 1 protein [Oscillospiraceae bacterium]|nr:glycoside hydrolase family 1 protein [Oscillospiraceae bacterium]
MHFTFPKDFMFGAACSAVQIEGGVGEGGKGEDVLDYYWRLQSEKYQDADPANAADFYHKYPEDIKLMKELGLRAFRFSISWTRIYPNGPEGAPCQAGIDYYSDMIDKLIEAGITPFFDLWHCDLPAWAIERDGCVNPEFVDWFVKYAETCFKAFGGRVKYWSTVNEPNVNVMAAYAWGVTPPFEKDIKRSLMACHHMILAHFKTVKLFREMGIPGKIGFVNHVQPAYALTLDKKDQEAAERDMDFYTNWFSDGILLGHYPESVLGYPYIADNLPENYGQELRDNFVRCDFLGINYYSSYIIQYEKNEVLDYKLVTGDLLPKDDYGFTVNPQGIFDAIMYCWDRYPGYEFVISENGLSRKKTGNYDEDLEDTYRINYMREHLRGLSRALRTGAPVTGYFHWSIMDTNELYVRGYSHIFGLIQVRHDKPTLDRVPRPSYYYYQQVIAQGEVN